MPNIVVDDDDVELLGRRQLAPGGVQPGLPLLLALRPPADEPSDELVPGRWREEDEEGVRHRLPDLAGALEVDLEEGEPPGRELLLDRAPRGVPYLARPWTTAHSSMSPAATIASNSSSETKR